MLSPTDRQRLRVGNDTEYLMFVRGADSASGKTQNWIVESKSSGDALGKIHWYGPWRQYVFVPHSNTIYNTGCLSDIREFLHRLAWERKVQRAAINLAAG